MVPDQIISRYGLLPTDKVIGDSFVQNETIYSWPGFPEGKGDFYIAGCNKEGLPLYASVLLIYKSEGKPMVTMEVTEEFMIDMPFEAIKYMVTDQPE